MSNGQAENVTIRHVYYNDIDSILALDQKVGVEKSSITYRDMLSLDFGGPLDFSFIAEAEGKVAGFIIARLSYVYVPFTEICIINGMIVDPAYQRRQIGNKLIAQLIDFCQDEGIYTIRALVHDKDVEFKRFIENLGFHRSIIINYDKTFEN